MNNRYFFSLNIVQDEVLGNTFVPYFLNRIDKTTYQRGKKITDVYLKKAENILKDWELKLISLSNSLTYPNLNKEFNKNNKKINFIKFFSEAEKNVKNHVKTIIDSRKQKILEIVKEKAPLLFLINDRNASILENDFIKISNDKAKVFFSFVKEDEKITYRLKLFLNKEQLDLQDTNFRILTNNHPVIVSKNKLIWFENKDFNGNKLIPFKTKNQINYLEKHKSFLFEKFIKPAVDKFDCEIIGFDFNLLKVTPKPILYLDQTIFKEFIIGLDFGYNDYKTPFYSTKKSFVKVLKIKNEYALERINRDFNLEKKHISFLLDEKLIQKEKYFVLPSKVVDKYDFIKQVSKLLDVFKKHVFSINNKLFTQNVLSEIPQINYTTHNKNDWFDLFITVKFGEFLIEFKELKNHILNHIIEYELPDGTIAIIPNEWFAELNAFAKRTSKKNRTIIQKNEFNLINDNKIICPNEEINKQIESFKLNEGLLLPKNSKIALRDYQKDGYKWLYSLTQNNFGVCLADDMGLGKTLQVITLLQKYFEGNSIETEISNISNEDKIGHQLSLFDEPVISKTTSTQITSALIVVPKSLIYNWVFELKKFATELSFVVYHNINRLQEFKQSIHKKELIITTYGVVRQDVDLLENETFSYIILDESHVIKNPNSKTYKALLRLHSQFKVSITGTPFENKLQDIWSQMNFLNHDILGNLSYFDESFVRPIKNSNDAPEIDELKSIISPFILRRLKSEVAKELPPKIEQVVYCKMLPKQAKWYEEEKSKVRNELLNTENKNKNFVNVLASINKLRQIAIHPKLQNVESNFDSGKFQTIIQYIQSILEQGDKFLIFSSYVKHLNLFKDYFIENDIDFKMLTGKSNNREKIVEEYETNKKIQPFLISIKAGGVGINLTSANYVFIIDPWWNPFVEQQAIDRTHRIGQTKNVMVYRFISKDTIEDKILKLQQSKISMSNAILDDNLIKNMNVETLTSLL